jgi:hypothetical protein
MYYNSDLQDYFQLGQHIDRRIDVDKPLGQKTDLPQVSDSFLKTTRKQRKGKFAPLAEWYVGPLKGPFIEHHYYWTK